MAKKVKKLSAEEKYIKDLEKQVELVDRAHPNALSYGTYGKPGKGPQNNLTFIGFEIEEGLKKPKYIKDFIMLVTYGFYRKDIILSETAKEQMTQYFNGTRTSTPTQTLTNFKLVIYSVFKDDVSGELYKIPQSGVGRGRSMEDIFILTKYFYKTANWKDFVNYVVRTVIISPNTRLISIVGQSAYACGAIRKNRIAHGSPLATVEPGIEYRGLIYNSNTKKLERYNLSVITDSSTGRNHKQYCDFNKPENVKRIHSNKNLNFLIKQSLIPEGTANDMVDNAFWDLFVQKIINPLSRYATRYDSKESFSQLVAKHIDLSDHTVYFYNPTKDLLKYLKIVK